MRASPGAHFVCARRPSGCGVATAGLPSRRSCSRRACTTWSRGCARTRATRRGHWLTTHAAPATAARTLSPCGRRPQASYIGACVSEIKEEVKSKSAFVKQQAVSKLVYLQMLGHDVSWASFHFIDVMALPHFRSKARATHAISTESSLTPSPPTHRPALSLFAACRCRSPPPRPPQVVGTLATGQTFHDGTEVALLTTNLHRKAIASSNQYEVSLALGCLAKVPTSSLVHSSPVHSSPVHV